MPSIGVAVSCIGLSSDLQGNRRRSSSVQDSDCCTENRQRSDSVQESEPTCRLELLSVQHASTVRLIMVVKLKICPVLFQTSNINTE